MPRASERTRRSGSAPANEWRSTSRRERESARALDVADLDADLVGVSSLLLDTSTLIAYLEGGRAESGLAATLVERHVASGRITAVVSTVTEMELLVGPLRNGRDDIARTIREFLRECPNLVVHAVSEDVAYEAALLRAVARLAPADALIVATGIRAGVGALVTADREWERLASLDRVPRVIYLS